MEKLDQVIEKICDLIIEEARNDWDETRSTHVKELADALESVANTRAAIESESFWSSERVKKWFS